MTKIMWELPLKTVSEINCSQHWTIKSKRHKLQQFFIRQLFMHEAQTIPFPCNVRMVRIGPRLLDSDNLCSAFKWIRDEISEGLMPWKKLTYLTLKGKAIPIKGRADSDPRITWEYSQEKNRKCSIRIEISSTLDELLCIGHE